VDVENSYVTFIRRPCIT